MPICFVPRRSSVVFGVLAIIRPAESVAITPIPAIADAIAQTLKGDTSFIADDTQKAAIPKGWGICTCRN